ncbi:MAG: hypothetical protein AAF191_17525, partial [Verrucomicrobiota bacterium]
MDLEIFRLSPAKSSIRPTPFREKGYGFLAAASQTMVHLKNIANSRGLATFVSMSPLAIAISLALSLQISAADLPLDDLAVTIIAGHLQITFVDQEEYHYKVSWGYHFPPSSHGSSLSSSDHGRLINQLRDIASGQRTPLGIKRSAFEQQLTRWKSPAEEETVRQFEEKFQDV